MRTLTLIACAAAFGLTASVATAAPKAPPSEASVACSKEADAKNLHGKARKTFRAKCKKTWKKPA